MTTTLAPSTGASVTAHSRTLARFARCLAAGTDVEVREWHSDRVLFSVRDVTPFQSVTAHAQRNDDGTWTVTAATTRGVRGCHVRTPVYSATVSDPIRAAVLAIGWTFPTA